MIVNTTFNAHNSPAVLAKSPTAPVLVNKSIPLNLSGLGGDEQHPVVVGAQLAERETRTLKHQLQKLIDQYNSGADGRPDKEIADLIWRLYGDGLKRACFIPKSVTENCSESVSEFDQALTRLMGDSLAANHSSYSLALSRLISWIVDDDTKLKALHQYEVWMSEADLVYVATHSRPRICQDILDRHLPALDRRDPNFIVEIAGAHPSLVREKVLDKSCFASEKNWGQLLKLCKNDPQLSTSLSHKWESWGYMSWRHRAALALGSNDAALALYNELVPILICYNDFDEDLPEDLQIAARLLMSQIAVAERWLAEEQMNTPEFLNPVLKAEILSRHPERFRGQLDFCEIADDPDAVILLAQRALPFYFDEISAYLKRYDILLDHEEALLRRYPVTALELLSDVDLQRTGCDLAYIAATYPSYTADRVVAACPLVDERSQWSLENTLNHPLVVAKMRSKSGTQYQQRAALFPESEMAWKNHQQLKDLPRETLLKRLGHYPCLVPLDGNPEAVLKACQSSSTLARQVMSSSLYSDLQKIDAARCYVKTLKELLHNPCLFLEEPNLICDEDVLFPTIMWHHQKSNAVEALQLGLLENMPAIMLFKLAKQHSDFALALLEKSCRHLLQRVADSGFLIELVLDNRIFKERLQTVPQFWLPIAQCYEQNWLTYLGFLKINQRGVYSECKKGDLGASDGNEPCSAQIFMEPHQVEMFIDRTLGTVQPPLIKGIHMPEFHQLDQANMTKKMGGRMRMGGVCAGICLDFCRWMNRHPERDPLDYICKLNTFEAFPQMLTTFDEHCIAELSLHRRSLPERLVWLQRNSDDFLATETTIGVMEGGHVVMDMNALQEILEKNQAVTLAQGSHCCALSLWKDPGTGKHQIILVDPNQGLYRFSGVHCSQKWPDAVRSPLEEAIKNAVLRYESVVKVTASTIDAAKLARVRLTPCKYTHV